MLIGLNRATILAFLRDASELIMTVPWACSAAVELVGAAHIQLIVSHALSVSVPSPFVAQTKSYHRQPAGLSGVMASAVVVLKHETSSIRQRHNFISIYLTFGVSDYVREVTSPDKVGSGPISGRDATWGQRIRVLVDLYIHSS